MISTWSIVLSVLSIFIIQACAWYVVRCALAFGAVVVAAGVILLGFSIAPQACLDCSAFLLGTTDGHGRWRTMSVQNGHSLCFGVEIVAAIWEAVELTHFRVDLDPCSPNENCWPPRGFQWGA